MQVACHALGVTLMVAPEHRLQEHPITFKAEHPLEWPLLTQLKNEIILGLKLSGPGGTPGHSNIGFHGLQQWLLDVLTQGGR